MASTSVSIEPSKQCQSNTAQVFQEYIVRIPKSKNKHFNVMRFSSALRVDITKWNQARMERENNLKEFKADEDLPKFGAGSEFGREHREEARRKKFGIISKKYNPEEQPWILKLGGKGGKKFKGIREGGVTENTSYYVFTQASDGTFEAFPVEEWYNFSPIQCYKALSAEEAEEEFGRRDKVLNYFSIMFKKRLKKEEDGEVEDAETKMQGIKKKGHQRKEFKISDIDDWVVDSDESEVEEEEKKEDSKQKKPGKNSKKKKNKNKESDDEALEESDEGDFDDREVDYMSDSSSSEEQEEEKLGREMKGVEDEEALRKLDMSGDEDEEANGNKDTEDNQEEKEKPVEQKPKLKPKKLEATEDKIIPPKGDSSGESSSESSDSDFDDSKCQSAVFMQKPKKKNGSDNSANSSRANTPTKMTNDGNKEGSRSSQKRKLGDSCTPGAKRSKTDSQPGTPTSSGSLEGITEDAVKRYLMRKPMTTTELLQKFKSKKTGMSSDQLVNTIAQILKKLKPDQQTIKGKLYLSIKM